MKDSEVVIGNFYEYKRNGKLVKIRILRRFNLAFAAYDVESGKEVYISSARKLRPVDN
jgi:hypothetical protein